MTRSKKLAIASFLTIFLVGIVLGLVLERFVLENCPAKQPKGDPSDFIYKKFTERLSLDEEQKSELKRLLAEIKEQHRQIRKQDHKKYKTIQQEFDAAFRTILTEEQLVIYEQMVKEFEERMKRAKRKRHTKD